MTELAEITLYDIEDVAKFLSITVKTANQLCRTKKLKATKVGRTWKVTKENLEKYLKI